MRVIDSDSGPPEGGWRAVLAGLEVAPLERERLQTTLGAIPAGVTSGLEIGFHELRVTELLGQAVDLVAIDHPRRVQPDHGHKLAFADIRSLPFPDGSSGSS